MVKKEPLLFAILLLLAAILALFVLYPLFKVFLVSLGTGVEGWFVHYDKLFRNPIFREPLFNSLLLGTIVAISSTLVGYFFAFVVGRTDVPGKAFFRSAATFPLIAPPFILALSAIILLGRNGLITRLLFPGTDFSIYGFGGLVIVQTLSFFPLAYLVCVGILDTIDPSVEEASINQGASGWQTLWKITLPLSLPGVASSLLVCFIESLADFATPLILSGNFRVLSVEAYLKIVGAERDMAGGAALAMCLLVPSIAAFFLQHFWLERKAFATVTGKPSTARIRGIGRWPRRVLTAVASLLAGVTLLFYGMVFYGAFTKVWGAQYSLTTAHFVHTFREGWDYIGNSLLVAGLATPFTGLLAMLIAYLVVRKRFPGRTLMDATAMLSLAVPGTVIGIGYILAFNEPPLMLQGTLAILILLNIFRNIPVGIRAGVATLKQIDRGIEEAAHNLGANSFGVFRRITLPLIAPAFYSSLAFSFMKCMTAISAIIFVVSGRWNLITIAILGYVENGELSKAAALSVALIAVVSAVLVLLRLVVKGREREFVSAG